MANPLVPQQVILQAIKERCGGWCTGVLMEYGIDPRGFEYIAKFKDGSEWREFVAKSVLDDCEAAVLDECARAIAKRALGFYHLGDGREGEPGKPVEQDGHYVQFTGERWESVLEPKESSVPTHLRGRKIKRNML